MNYRKKTTIFLLIMAFVLMTLLSACSRQTSNNTSNPSGTSTTSNATNKKPDEVVYSSFIIAATLDPQRGASNDQPESRPIYSALLDTELGTHELKPDLAEKYEVSDDGKTYIFHLRKGVKFHKGYGELKASDVVFTFERLLDPKTASRYAKDFKMLDSVTAPDEYTVVFILKTPFTPFPYFMSDSYMGAYILSEKAVNQYGDKYGKNPIGTGPYMMEEWQPSNKLVYSANPDYYRGAPKIKKLTYLEITEAITAFMSLQKGEINALMIQEPENLAQAKTLSNIDILTLPTPTIYSLFMNTKEKPFDDIRVRQAVNYAIDKGELVKTVFDDMYGPAKGYVGSALKGYTLDGVKQYEHNPEKAKQLLTEAGYPNGFSIQTEITSTTTMQRVFTVLQAQLAKVGIKLEFQPAQTPQWAKFNYSGQAKFGFWPFISAPEIHFPMYYYFHSNSKPPAANAAYYAGIDDLINKAAVERDWNVRAQLYTQAQQKLAEDTPYIPLFETKNIILTDKHLKGVVPGGAYTGDVRFENAHWE